MEELSESERRYIRRLFAVLEEIFFAVLALWAA
jgi:hypothetical protein